MTQLLFIVYLSRNARKETGRQIQLKGAFTEMIFKGPICAKVGY